MESILWKTKQCHFTVVKVAWIPLAKVDTKVHFVVYVQKDTIKGYISVKNVHLRSAAVCYCCYFVDNHRSLCLENQKKCPGELSKKLINASLSKIRS